VTDETRPLDAAIDRPSPEMVKAYLALSPNELSDVLELSCVMRYEIHPLWPGMPRIAGPAFTIRTGKHDNLMFHASIYLARPGDIIVVEIGLGESAAGTTPNYNSELGGIGTDHANANSDVTGSVPWVEFSANLVFQKVGGQFNSPYRGRW